MTLFPLDKQALKTEPIVPSAFGFLLEFVWCASKVSQFRSVWTRSLEKLRSAAHSLCSMNKQTLKKKRKKSQCVSLPKRSDAHFTRSTFWISSNDINPDLFKAVPFSHTLKKTFSLTRKKWKEEWGSKKGGRQKKANDQASVSLEDVKISVLVQGKKKIKALALKSKRGLKCRHYRVKKKKKATRWEIAGWL